MISPPPYTAWLTICGVSLYCVYKNYCWEHVEWSRRYINKAVSALFYVDFGCSIRGKCYCIFFLPPFFSQVKLLICAYKVQLQWLFLWSWRRHPWMCCIYHTRTAAAAGILWKIFVFHERNIQLNQHDAEGKLIPRDWSSLVIASHLHSRKYSRNIRIRWGGLNPGSNNPVHFLPRRQHRVGKTYDLPLVPCSKLSPFWLAWTWCFFFFLSSQSENGFVVRFLGVFVFFFVGGCIRKCVFNLGLRSFPSSGFIKHNFSVKDFIVWPEY